MIEVREVAKWYGEVVALSRVTTTIGPGLTALLGPNGAGKSSLIRILCGLTSPSQGQVRVLGRNPRSDRQVRKSLGLDDRGPTERTETDPEADLPAVPDPLGEGQ